MRVFKVEAEHLSPLTAKTYIIYSDRRWSIPAVECTRCGSVWGSMVVTYPDANLSVLNADGIDWPVHPISVPEYERLREVVRPLLPAGTEHIPPGTEFGPLEGTVFGRAGDFAWAGVSNVLVRQQTLQLLKDAGCAGLRSLSTMIVEQSEPQDECAEAEVDSDAFPQYQGRWEEFVELDIPALATLAPEAVRIDPADECRFCGRTGKRFLGLIIDSDSVPRDADLFRPKWATGYILATERFVHTVQQFNLTGLAFHEVELR